MRRAFAKWITEKALKDKTIYLIVNDIGYGYFDSFIKKYPSRFLNLGLTEQATMSIAAGMALQELKPYVYSITPFVTERCFEQIKVDVCCNNANVKIVGYDDYPDQGPTHEALQDGVIMKYLIECYWPRDSIETQNDLEMMYQSNCPAFIRLRKDKNVR